MQISEILSPERVRCALPAASKKRTLEMISDLLVDGNNTTVSNHAVFDCLVARERLGSTSLGDGVALPHARMANVDSACGAFVRLAEPVDFDAPDGALVDLVFALLVPEDSTDEHLEILATLAESLSDAQLRSKLRSCSSEQGIYDVLTVSGSPRD